MNGSAWVEERRLKNGEQRFDVRYRRGGRAFPAERAGTFKSRRDAKARASLVNGLLARGIDPRQELVQERERTITELWGPWVASLKDVGDARKAVIRDAWRHIEPVLGSLPPSSVQPADAMRVVERMQRVPLAPSTIKLYFTVARQFMDSVGCDVLRNRLIRLPKVVSEEVEAMSYREFMLLRKEFAEPTQSKTGNRIQSSELLLALDFIEATALRVGDAKQLRRGDVDLFEGKVRVSKARGKSQKSRWVPVPIPLLEQLAERDQQPDDLLLPELTSMDLQGHMRRACARAGIKHYHPHDLRHRRASLWVYQGLPLPLVAQRVGHSDQTTTVRQYTHVVIDATDRWRAEDYVGGVR